MANEQNLTKKGKKRQLSTEEAQRIGKKGGEASGEARQKRKALREELEILLQTKADNGKTYQECMSLALIKKAFTGDTRAYEVIRNTIGEKPKEQIEYSGNINNPFSGLSTEELRQLIKDE